VGACAEAEVATEDDFFAPGCGGGLETAAPCSEAVAGFGEPAGDAWTGGVAIGPAGAGFFRASSATVNSIARLIGIRATPLFLSTHAYVVSSVPVSSRNFFKFSTRFFARVSS
jgi:hypothetical protein